MHSTGSESDHALRQFRLSRFGLVLALIGLSVIGVTFLLSLWLGRLSFNRSSVLLLVASASFASLWLLLRQRPRSRRFVRTVELSTLLIGTGAFSAMAVALSTQSPVLM